MRQLYTHLTGTTSLRAVTPWAVPSLCERVVDALLHDYGHHKRAQLAMCYSFDGDFGKEFFIAKPVDIGNNIRHIWYYLHRRAVQHAKFRPLYDHWLQYVSPAVLDYSDYARVFGTEAAVRIADSARRYWPDIESTGPRRSAKIGGGAGAGRIDHAKPNWSNPPRKGHYEPTEKAGKLYDQAANVVVAGVPLPTAVSRLMSPVRQDPIQGVVVISIDDNGGLVETKVNPIRNPAADILQAERGRGGRASAAAPRRR